jgi:hypothetical protein
MATVDTTKDRLALAVLFCPVATTPALLRGVFGIDEADLDPTRLAFVVEAAGKGGPT